MWMITDSTDVVQDKNSSEGGLSRGYIVAGVAVGDDVALLAAGYHKYEKTDKVSVKIFDAYDGVTVIQNTKERAKREIRGVKMSMVEASIRLKEATSIGATKLGFTSIVTELQNEYDALEARRVTLREIINS